jgi:iron complex transport system substrate-binding protein
MAAVPPPVNDLAIRSRPTVPRAVAPTHGSTIVTMALGVLVLAGAVGLGVVLASGIAAPASAAPQQPQTTTAPGPRRIVSLVPATTEMLFAIGAGTRLAGVSSYDRFPSEVDRLPRVGGLLDPNVERILSLRPDLVIAYDTQVDLKQRLARAGIPIFPYAHRDLADVTSTLRALGARISAGAAAEDAATRIERQLADTRARVAGRPRPKTLLVFGHDPGALRRVDASAGYGFLHDLLDLAGGADVLGDLAQQSVQMSTEMILTRAPEVIVDLRYGESLRPNAPDDIDAERRIWSALPSLPAVRNSRVYVLIGDEFVVPGPRIVLAAERLARTLHPEAYGKP